MPAANVEKRKRSSDRQDAAGKAELQNGPPIQHLVRQIQEMKRQNARMSQTVLNVLAKPSQPLPLPLVRLRAAASAAPRRLGVPLRGNSSRIEVPLQKAPDDRRSVKQQVPSDDDARSPIGTDPLRGFGYGDGDQKPNEVLTVPRVPPKSQTQRSKARLIGQKGVVGVQRSRNFIGCLLGHLASARRRLSEEGRAIHKPKRKAHAAFSLGTARILVKDELRQSRRSNGPRKRQALRSPEALEQIDTERTQVDEETAFEDEQAEYKEDEEFGKHTDTPELAMAQLQRRLETHYSLMKNFIRTRTEPTIFFLPVTLTKETEQALEETREAIDQKVASLRTHLRGADDPEESQDDHYDPGGPSEGDRIGAGDAHASANRRRFSHGLRGAAAGSI